MNVAARAGRWSAAHWKTATFGWLALVAAAGMIGNAVGNVSLSNSDHRRVLAVLAYLQSEQ
jgi:hypothetical protein